MRRAGRRRARSDDGGRGRLRGARPARTAPGADPSPAGLPRTYTPEFDPAPAGPHPGDGALGATAAARPRRTGYVLLLGAALATSAFLVFLFFLSAR